MRDVRFEWLKKEDKTADDVLSMLSMDTGLEIAQLRRLHGDRSDRELGRYSAYAKNVWSFRAVHYDDAEVTSHFGVNWQDEVYRGFANIQEFKDWLDDRRYRDSVSKKRY